MTPNYKCYLRNESVDECDIPEVENVQRYATYPDIKLVKSNIIYDGLVKNIPDCLTHYLVKDYTLSLIKKEDIDFKNKPLPIVVLIDQLYVKYKS